MNIRLFGALLLGIVLGYGVQMYTSVAMAPAPCVPQKVVVETVVEKTVSVPSAPPTKIPTASDPVTFSERGDHDTRRHICVIVRTMPAHTEGLLQQFLYNMVTQEYRHFDVFLMDTSVSDVPLDVRLKALQEIVDAVDDPRIHVSTSSHSSSDPSKNYAYSPTERERVRLVSATKDRPEYCQYFMFTNGDNVYHKSFFNVFAAKMRSDYMIIASSFLHHDVQGIRPIQAILEDDRRMDGAIDLGAALIRKSEVARLSLLAVAQDDVGGYWNIDYKYFRRIIHDLIRSKGSAAAQRLLYVHPVPMYFHQ